MPSAPPVGAKPETPAQAAPPAQAPGNNKGASDCVKRGDELQKQKDYDGAIAQYNRAIELDPNAADEYRHRGVAKNNQGRNRFRQKSSNTVAGKSAGNLLRITLTCSSVGTSDPLKSKTNFHSPLMRLRQVV